MTDAEKTRCTPYRKSHFQNSGIVDYAVPVPRSSAYLIVAATEPLPLIVAVP